MSSLDAAEPCDYKKQIQGSKQSSCRQGSGKQISLEASVLQLRGVEPLSRWLICESIEITLVEAQTGASAGSVSMMSATTLDGKNRVSNLTSN